MHSPEKQRPGEDGGTRRGPLSGLNDQPWLGGSVNFNWASSRLSRDWQTSSKTMVVFAASVKGFQWGSPFVFGSPVRAKAIHASLIFAASARAASPSPVMRSQRAVLLKTNASSEQWKDMRRPSSTGVCHANW